MRSCPTCQRAFDNDSLTFCLVDGSVLSAPSANRAQEIPATLLSSAPPSFAPPSEAGGGAGGNTRWLIIGGAAAVVLVVGLISLAAIVILLIANNRSVAERNKNLAADANKAVALTSNTASNKSANTAASGSTTAANGTSKSAPDNFDMIGTWAIKSGRGYRAALVIDSQDGDSFSGVITHQTNRIAVSGVINPETGAVSMKDTKIIYSKNKNWSMGTYNGTISSDGRQMKTKTIDGYGSTTDTFTKQ